MKRLSNPMRLRPLPPAALWAVVATSVALFTASLSASLHAREALIEAVRGWTSAQTGIMAERLEVGPLDARLQVRECTQPLDLDFPFASRNTVRVRCAAPVWQLHIRVSQVDHPAGVIPAAGGMAQGQNHNQNQNQSQSQAGGHGGQPGHGGHGGQPGQPGHPAQHTGQASSWTPGSPGSPGPQGAQAHGPGARGGPPGATRPEPVKVVASRAHLRPGMPLSADLLDWVELDPRQVTRDHLTAIEGIDQFELIRPLRAGEPVRTGDLRPAMLVRKGQSVILSVRTGGLAIDVRLEALQDGRMGEQIRLKNPDSGRVVSGVVIGPNAARTI